MEAPRGKCLLWKKVFFLLFLRCQGAEAFEIQHSGLANGIFMKFLKDRLLEDKKITVLLDEVAEGKIKNKELLRVLRVVIILVLLLLCRFGTNFQCLVQQHSCLIPSFSLDLVTCHLCSIT